MYDGHCLDILEFGVENYKGLADFKGDQPMAGGKPCFYICGDGWEATPQLEATKNFLVDFFRGTVADCVNITGLDRVITAVLDKGKVLLRQYLIRRKKATGGALHKGVHLEECGPSMTLAPRRTALATEE